MSKCEPLYVFSGANANTPSRMYDEQKRVWRFESPLVTAARLGDVRLLSMLVEKGAELNTPDNSLGKTALNWACARQHTDVAQYLIRYGADIHKGDYCSETPMTEAIGNRDLIVVQMLVNYGIHLDTHVNYDRDTALLFAVLINEPCMAEILIQAGANVNVMNRNGEECMTAILWSQQLRDEELVAYFCKILIGAGYKVKKEQLKKARAIGDDTCATILEESLYMPSMLSSLCRLLIRKKLIHLSNHASLLPLVEKLPLPERLKMFLKLEIL